MCGFLASAGIQDHDRSEAKGNVHQRHPKWKYHRTGKSIIVQNSDAEAALGEGWGDSPAGPFIPQDADPLLCFDQWELESLSDEAKQHIRKGLADAHAAVLDSVMGHDIPDHPSARPSVATDPMADPGLAGDSAIALAEQRRRVVAPILKDKRWTTSRWATQAGVSKNSAYEYLAGKRQLREENRKALAEVLDLKPEAL